MIIGIGIDIVENERIGCSIEKHGEHFLKKTFTEQEIEYCSAKASSLQSYAARFAAKEAAMKALGTGWQKGVGFLSVEVTREGTNAPKLLLHGQAKVLADEMGLTSAHISISHSDSYSIAQVILEGRD
jgi:holo-[acyl-carrier protein] synthase